MPLIPNSIACFPKQASENGSRSYVSPTKQCKEQLWNSSRINSECCWLAASKAFSPSEVTPWQYADSLTIPQFLGLKLTDHSPDHTSLTVVRERLPSEVHHTVFQRVLGLTNSKVLLVGKTVAVDSSTLEADAAMKSIGRRDSPSDRKGHKTTNQGSVHRPYFRPIRW